MNRLYSVLSNFPATTCHQPPNTGARRAVAERNHQCERLGGHAALVRKHPGLDRERSAHARGGGQQHDGRASGGRRAFFGDIHWTVGTYRVRYIIGTFLLIIILTAITGNILVCLAIYTDRRLRKLGNLFLVSLAVADLLVSSLVMTFAVINDLMGYWAFGPAVL
ncbi:hypothetical protein MRX96_054358 [Rhipicephalus microplus]